MRTGSISSSATILYVDPRLARDAHLSGLSRDLLTLIAPITQRRYEQLKLG